MSRDQAGIDMTGADGATAEVMVNAAQKYAIGIIAEIVHLHNVIHNSMRIAHCAVRFAQFTTICNRI